MTIARDLERARSAFDKPTLTMLRSKWAPVVLAVFSTHFTRDRARIPTDRFHLLVDTSLDDLRARGEEVPDLPGRDLCRRWVNDRWLALTANEQNVEEYSLTSHAQEALDYVTRLSGDRAMFGESRIRTILDAARNCAIEASPDRTLRLARLDDEIERLTTERDRIAAGGEIEPASADRMLEEYLNLADLLSALPSDFMRVSETFKDIHRRIVADFRSDERRSGEVLEAYLDEAERLMETSAEGRAFTGAVALLRDNRLLEELRSDLATILEHNFAEVLDPVERQNLRRTTTAIWNGIDSVLEQRRRLSGTLRTHMARQDALRDKELDEALRSAQENLAVWMEHSGPRARVPLNLEVGTLNLTHLREKTYNPEDHTPPAPLAQPAPADGPRMEFAELRKQGGPAFADLLRRIADRLDAEASGQVDAAEVFNTLPEDLRRPVEVLGMMHLSATGTDETTTDPTPAPEAGEGDLLGEDAGAPASDEAGLDPRSRLATSPARTVDTVPYETVHPDGTRQVYRAPRLTFTHQILDTLNDTPAADIPADKRARDPQEDQPA